MPTVFHSRDVRRRPDALQKMLHWLGTQLLPSPEASAHELIPSRVRGTPAPLVHRDDGHEP